MYRINRNLRFTKNGPIHRGKVVNSWPKIAQSVTKPETPLQIIQGRSIATNSTRYSQRNSEGRNILGCCVLADTLVQYFYTVLIISYTLITATIRFNVILVEKGEATVGHGMAYGQNQNHHSDSDSDSDRRPSLRARFIGPTWGPSGADRTQVAPYWPHEPCYLWYFSPSVRLM